MGKKKNRNCWRNKDASGSVASSTADGPLKDSEVNWLLQDSAENDTSQANGNNSKFIGSSLKHDSELIYANIENIKSNSLENDVQSCVKAATGIQDFASKNVKMEGKDLTKVAGDYEINQDKTDELYSKTGLSSKKGHDSLAKEFDNYGNMHGVKPKVKITKPKANGKYVDDQQVIQKSFDSRMHQENSYYKKSQTGDIENKFDFYSSNYKTGESFKREFSSSGDLQKPKKEVRLMNNTEELQQEETKYTLNKKRNTYASQYTAKNNLAIVPRSNNIQNSAYVNGNNPRNSHTFAMSDSKQKSLWKNLKDDMYRTVGNYKKSKSIFSVTYNKWLKERKENLEKLRSLIKAVHDDQLNFNKAQVIYRSAGQTSRTFKADATTDAGSFFTGLAAFLSDVASGITSVAQVFNVESYRDTFQDIMDEDAKITKSLYDARSQCHRKYKDIEEVMQNFQTNSLNSTVANISNALQVGKFWVAVKTANQNDDLMKALDIVGTFVGQACNPVILNEIRNSVATYVDDNPAALDACCAAGRAVGGVIDSFITKQSNKSRLNKEISRLSNLEMAKMDQIEINRLNLSIEQDLSQTKLEDQIQDKIDSLEYEMKEIINDYYHYLQDGISDDEDSSDDEKYCDASDNYYSFRYN